MPIGFDRTTVDALVVHGYALTGLTRAQCQSVERAVARLGSGLVAAPHGDLSGPGAPETPAGCTFVVGTLVGRARTAAVEDATTQSASVNDATRHKARAAFEAAQPLLDGALRAGAIVPDGEPGLFVVAAGPRASARLDGDPGARIAAPAGPGTSAPTPLRLDVSSEKGGDAVRVELAGQLTLSAHYG